MTKQQRKILIKIIIGAVLFAVAMAVTENEMDAPSRASGR